MKTSLILHPQNGKDVLLLGEFPERSNGTDCKSAGYAFGGSNPSLPTFLLKKILFTKIRYQTAVC